MAYRPCGHHKGKPLPYQVPLSFRLSLVIVPRLISERLALPHVLEHGVYQRLADQNAEVHDEEHVHGPKHKTATALSYCFPDDPEQRVPVLTSRAKRVAKKQPRVSPPPGPVT